MSLRDVNGKEGPQGRGGGPTVMFVSLLPVSTNVSTFGMLASKFFDILITRLLFSKSVFSLGRSGNPSNFTISLSDKSIASNWFYVSNCEVSEHVVCG